MWRWRLVAKLCPSLCDPVDWSRQAPIHGILLAIILGWVAVSFSWGSFWPGDRTLSLAPTGRQTLYCWAPGWLLIHPLHLQTKNWSHSDSVFPFFLPSLHLSPHLAHPPLFLPFILETGTGWLLSLSQAQSQVLKTIAMFKTDSPLSSRGLCSGGKHEHKAAN